ncbi:tRNA epoxyqueuosine(34) reductase QueG [Congregibacter litoralis]|uniref:Epoxyqueuosine reductase n=1 Tax=Congregibacter litoralis KT71 TaxID=314285 RepID=A4A6L1_9GAMM|nr:tRNA epoxyqueuosine(34) reductase QueG [Congregibacter litoralis]EAQ98658.1 putative iron-sulfur cluster binding protein [Congregibacter litoralis KT71]
MTENVLASDGGALVEEIRAWARDLGFAQLGISDIDLGEHEAYLQRWLAAGYQGEMQWMGDHGTKRSRPEELVPGTCRVLTLRMNYLGDGADPMTVLENPHKAYIARYTLGRDYHKLVRKRLAQLAKRIEQRLGQGHYRAFVDSAPVLERALAERAGLGWIAKNTMLINQDAGSWFFLGEIYTDLPLPVDPPQESKHCGSCQACLDICPTKAFAGPFELDARRCISYLTIEHKGSIDPELRPLMGNRIFGCDDCQLVCPWNKFARSSQEKDFQPRHGLDDSELMTLFSWDEDTWAARTEGSALRRIGYERWLRNLAIALGNAPGSPALVEALQRRASHPSELVREHVHWALSRHGALPS